MERIRIDHDSGYLDLNIEAFFPCTIQKARKVFPLINRFCPYEDRAALMAELTEMADGYDALCQMYTSRISAFSLDARERRRWSRELKQTEVLRKRLRRNITFLEV